MSTFLKTLIGLGVALPLGAFVAGSLVAASESSTPRERIVIRDDATPTNQESPDASRDQDPGREPPADDVGEDGENDDERDDETDDGGGSRDDTEDDDSGDDDD